MAVWINDGIRCVCMDPEPLAVQKTGPLMFWTAADETVMMMMMKLLHQQTQTHWTLFKGFCASCLLSDDGLNKQTRCSRARTLKLAVFLLFCLIVLFYASFFSSKLLRTRTAVSEIGGKLHAWTPFSRNCWYFQKVPTVRSVLLWFWGEGFGSVNSGLPLRQARQMDPLSTKDFN